MSQCLRCKRDLNNPRAMYGWRCAQILGVQTVLNDASDKTWNVFIEGTWRGRKFR